MRDPGGLRHSGDGVTDKVLARPAGRTSSLNVKNPKRTASASASCSLPPRTDAAFGRCRWFAIGSRLQVAGSAGSAKSPPARNRWCPGGEPSPGKQRVLRHRQRCRGTTDSLVEQGLEGAQPGSSSLAEERTRSGDAVGCNAEQVKQPAECFIKW